MRALVVLAFVSSLAGGCVEPAGPALALGAPLGDRLYPRSLRVVGDQPYWMEMAEPVMDQPASLRLRRARAEGVDTIDTLAGVYVEQGGPFVLADGDDLVWGLGSALLGCGTGHWLHAAAPPVPLRLLEDGVCRALPVALRDDRLLVMTAAGTDGAPTTALARHTLATDAAEPVGQLADWPVEWPLVDGGDVVAVMTTPARYDEGQLVQSTLDDPATARSIGATIADRGGVAITETEIVVVDNGGAGAPARVLAYRRTASADEPATVVATLPGPAHDLTWSGGALWMIPGEPRATGGGRIASPSLWRVELDGTRTEFTLAAPLAELASDSAGLIAAVEDAAGLRSARRIASPPP